MLIPPSIVNTILATRYLSAAAATVSLWDHALNLAKEIQCVWLQPWSALQILLVCNRYGGEASLLFLAYMNASSSLGVSAAMCQASSVIVSVYCLINSATSQFALLLCAYSLWESRKAMRHALVVGFIVCFGISFAFAVVTLHTTFDTTTYSSAMRTCLQSGSSFIVGMWGGLILFDLFAVGLMVLNALQTPRRSDSEIVSRLLRDGVNVFLACFGLRMFQLILSLPGHKPTLGFGAVVAWAFDNVITFRYFLKVKALDTRGQNEWESVAHEQSVYVYKEVEISLL